MTIKSIAAHPRRSDATISPLDAVADVHLHGPISKTTWSGVRLAFLVGWPNRRGVLANWIWALAAGLGCGE